MVGPQAPLAVWHLTAQYDGKFAWSHPSTLLQACLLNGRRRRDYNHLIHPLFASSFKEKRNIEHDEAPPLTSSASEEGPLSFAHQRMKNGLEPGKRGGIRDDQSSQTGAIHDAGVYHVGECAGDWPNGPTATPLEGMYGTIGIENRNAGTAEDICSRRLAHPHTPSEPDYSHPKVPVGLSCGGVPGRRRPCSRLGHLVGTTLICPEVAGDEFEHLLIHRGKNVEPSSEAVYGLVHEHAKSTDGAEAPGAGTGEERRDYRRIDDVRHDERVRCARKVDLDRRPTLHTGGCRIHQERLISDSR